MATGPKKVVVVGATGNIGTNVVRALGADEEIGSITGIARRRPEHSVPKTTWVAADITTDDLVELVRGADAVIHLAWLFQPTHRPPVTWHTNVTGSLRVFDAVAEAGVPALIHASSVGAYSPGPKDRAVDETWPTNGWPDAAYTREKAYLERVLDVFERDHPDVRVVRLRPGFVFTRRSASQQRRLFAGPLLPHRVVRPALVPVVPDLPGLRFQVVHGADVAEAFRLAVHRPVAGAFNIAAEPVVDARVLADRLRARVVPLPSARPVRAAVAAAWRLHLVPASPHLFDAVRALPIMDTGRARSELGWSPRHDATDALNAFLTGLRRNIGDSTPPLAPSTPAGRAREVRTGVGREP